MLSGLEPIPEEPERCDCRHSPKPILSCRRRTVSQLLLRGIPGLKAKERGQLPRLHAAAAAGNTQAVEHLIQANAPLEATEREWGRTALHIAAYLGHTETVGLLVRNNADPEARDTYATRSTLHLAVERDHRETAKLLIALNADLEAQDRDRSTPLHVAATGGNKKMVELLTESNADLEARDRWELTPLQQASVSGHRETKELLEFKMKEKSASSAFNKMLSVSVVLASVAAVYVYSRSAVSNPEGSASESL